MNMPMPDTPALSIDGVSHSYGARKALDGVTFAVSPASFVMLLGLNGIAVKSHGGADALGFANAIGVAVDMKINGFVDQIRDEIARLNAIQTPPSTPQAASL